MRFLLTAVPVVFLCFGAANALADDATPVVPPSTPAVAAPAAAADVAKTADEKKVVVESAPVVAAPAAPTYNATAVYSAGPTYVAPAPMGDCGCYQSRDACGWALDKCGDRYGRWNISLAGMYSSTGSTDGILGEKMFIPGNQLNWNNVDFDGKFGGRVGISYATEPQSRIELVGTYYGKPDGSDAQTGQFAARPGVLGFGDISRPTNAAFTADAETYGGELNWWNEIACKGHWRTDAGVGFRYLSFEENARVDFTNVVGGAGPFPVGNGFVTSNARNRFYGGQACFATHYDINCDWQLGASVKGLFGALDRNLTVTDLNVFVGGNHRARNDDNNFVFGVNLDLTLSWHIRKHIGVFAGYDLLVLDNVQRAEDGMDFSQSNSGAVQAKLVDGQLVIHSLFLGVVFDF